jgi:hypothetical protein
MYPHARHQSVCLAAAPAGQQQQQQHQQTHKTNHHHPPAVAQAPLPPALGRVDEVRGPITPAPGLERKNKNKNKQTATTSELAVG